MRFTLLIIVIATLLLVACSEDGTQTPLPNMAKVSVDPNSSADYQVKRFVVSVKYETATFDENTYLVYDQSTKDAVIIDPGARSTSLEMFIIENSLQVKAVLNTHGHADHVGANGFYANMYSCDVYSNNKDIGYYGQSNPEILPTALFTSESNLQFGNMVIQLIYTPGHTEGSTCFYIGNHLFSGDTLFKGSVGRTWDSGDKSAEELQISLIYVIKEKLLILPDTTIVYPGHLDTTTIGYERKSNPYLK